jgi:two-component system alkaline phosphatase synthesis response regulator PhoP
MKKRVLIVDDDRFITEVYRGYLARAGYEVEVAPDGATALDRLAVFRPDVMLLDLMMPGVDGLATLKRVRASDEFNSLPVIILTNIFVPSLIKDAFEAGATKVFEKATVAPVILVGVLQEVFTGRPVGAGVG